jgi:hypothetical protein
VGGGLVQIFSLHMKESSGSFIAGKTVLNQTRSNYSDIMMMTVMIASSVLFIVDNVGGVKTTAAVFYVLNI